MLQSIASEWELTRVLNEASKKFSQTKKSVWKLRESDKKLHKQRDIQSTLTLREHLHSRPYPPQISRVSRTNSWHALARHIKLEPRLSSLHSSHYTRGWVREGESEWEAHPIHTKKSSVERVLYLTTVTLALLKGNMVVVSEGRAVSVQTVYIHW